MSTKAAHTSIPWFKYQQWPDRFSIGAYRRGSICIDIGSMIPKEIVTASGDDSISEEEALANVDIVITAVNHHQELITRLYNLKNQVELWCGSIESIPMGDERIPAGMRLALIDTDETLKKLIQ